MDSDANIFTFHSSLITVVSFTRSHHCIWRPSRKKLSKEHAMDRDFVRFRFTEHKYRLNKKRQMLDTIWHVLFGPELRQNCVRVVV